VKKSGQIKFAVDLITFFHPAYWNVGNHGAIVELARAEPRSFWDRMLDGIAEAGVTGVELTFSPFNWQDAIKTYGSRADFAKALEGRGLSLASGFFAELEHGSDLTDEAVQRTVLARAELYAELIAACGGDAMVMGLPMRQTPNSRPPAFVDLAMTQQLADFINRVGAVVAQHGIKLALHTEAHSMFAMSRDVDLFMLLTDPVYVGFCPDAAHLVLVGSDPIEVVKRHRDRLVVAHWKDAIGPMPADTPIDTQIHDRHRPYFCRLGAGRVDWPAWARLHRDLHFTGWAILELDAAADPVGEITACRQFVEAALLPIIG
jgi:sugar phosphate isomerase/epimerase